MDLASVENVNTFARGGADTATVTDLAGTGVRRSTPTSAAPTA